MKRDADKNEMFRTSHLTILLSYTAFSALLIIESLLLHWELWAVLLIAGGVIFSWNIQILRRFSDNVKIWLYSALMMFSFFFYGIHTTSTFDLAAVMSAVIAMYTLSGIKGLINLCQMTYCMTFGYGIIFSALHGGKFGVLEITRSMLHIAMIFLVCRFSRRIIDKWAEIDARSHGKIEKLTETSERLNDFLANVSHELRTPINAVIGLSGICIDKEKNEELLADMKSVQTAGRRVSDQIGDILDYSEIVSGKLACNDEDYMLSSVLNDLVIELRPFKPADLELVIDVDPAIPSVMNTDISKLKKILRHLIMNGLKYTSEGGVYVRISAIEQVYGVNLCIEVTDTGIGMTQEELERAGERFYQADSGRARNGGGLGLGLSVVSGFVARLGGFMTINSEPNGGTTVHVSLPQKVTDPAGCMSVVKRERLCLGAFLHFEKFAHPIVREYYNVMVRNIVKGLGVQMHRVDNISNLKKLHESVKMSHLFVGEEEYTSAPATLEKYAREMMVIVVADSDFRLPEGSKARIMEKPFYCFPVAAVLNTDPENDDESERRMYCNGAEALVVDDEPMNLVVAKSILRRYGMNVTTAISGQEAVDICREKDFSIVFMDHMMPGMDGVETMKRIRAESVRGSNEMPIVALTANAVSSAKEMFMTEGFDGFVSKPIELVELERVLVRVLPKSVITYETVGEEVPAVNDAPEPAREKISASDMLRSAGIDTETGLHYCQDDKEFYDTILMQFASEADKKLSEMKRFYAENDLHNYGIRVHALKSTAKMIGASELSEMARGLEFASKEGREDYIRENHDDTMSVYENIVGVIFSVFGMSRASASVSAEDEVMEFLPDPVDAMEFQPEGGEH